MNTAIQIEGLSKRYKLGEVSTGSLAHDLNRWFYRLKGDEDPYSRVGEANDRTKNLDGDYMLALKNVNLEIHQGEVLGLIGRNGAGKSTLLKILSRTTAPTHGTVKIKGKVASLLEVGTGFHPELTGRDNVFLNGAILGMTRREIQKKFDEIVDFSGVEKYIDTPVKRYSSGMYVRLAFAVAAHLEPDILIIDEVLAVGDADFQKKCLGKMRDVSDREGRTVIFVSHSMPMIASLCKRACILNSGVLVFDGNAASAVHQYQNGGRENSAILDYSNSEKVPGDKFATLRRARIEDLGGTIKSEFEICEPLKIIMEYEVKDSFPLAPFPNFHFFDQFGQYVFVSAPTNRNIDKGRGIYEAICSIPGNFLNVGHFSIGLALTFHHLGIHVSFYEPHALNITMTENIDSSATRSANYSGEIPGVVRPILDWTVKKIS